MRADVVVCLVLDGISTFDNDRLFPDVLDRLVADFRYLIKTRACLPGLAPELFVFELGEFRINVAADADTVRHRLPARWPAVAAARRVLRGCVLCQKIGRAHV